MRGHFRYTCALKRLRAGLFGVKPSLCCDSLRVSLKCAANASLLYLKGGAYMAVEYPTGGPNDVVFNTNGLVLLWSYAWERSYSGISLPCPWKSSVRHSHALSCRNGARV